jgi:hypothetical protein
MGYLSRQPNSNEPPRRTEGKSQWLEETDISDEFALLLSGDAKRCVVCRLAVRKKHLDAKGQCPDCQ